MKINYYRYPSAQGEDESWQNCQFTHETDFSQFTGSKPLVSINDQPVIRQHHVTYLTGKDTCRAHHFAKHLAIQVLTATPQQPVEVLQASSLHNPGLAPCKVLWIDTLHGPHICTSIFRELVAHSPSKENLHFVCLDILGGQRENFYAINRNIEALIRQFKPELVVIDDIDHFMPFCGVRIATEFCRIVRDVTNHTETAFLFIGYNHLGKKASTTGNLGKYLFLDASDVFSLSTQREVTTVRLVRSYDLSRCPDDTEYRFTIGDDNLPHEAQRDVNQPIPEGCDSSTSHTSNQQVPSNIHEIINTSLTFPTYPSAPNESSVLSKYCKPLACKNAEQLPGSQPSASRIPARAVPVLQATGL